MKKPEEQIIEQVDSKWIYFLIVERKPKTIVIKVSSVDNNYCIGRIYWLSRWRCYIFEPNTNTIYEKVCMRDIANLLELLTNNQRIK